MAVSIFASDIRDLKLRRLHELERQQAQQGYSTPPEIANEIKDLRAELGLARSPATLAESHDILFTLVQEVRADVRRLYWLLPVLLLIVILAVKL